MQQLLRDHYFLTLLPDFREGMWAHIFYSRFMLQGHWTLIHFTTDPHKAKYFSASKAPGVPAVKKSLPSLRLWCLLNSEHLSPWLRCTQQLYIPVRRVLAPQLSSSTEAGWLFCALSRGSDMLLSIGYMVMTMLLLWWELQINIRTSHTKMYSKRTKEDDRNTPKPGPRERFQLACMRVSSHHSRNDLPIIRCQ